MLTNSYRNLCESVDVTKVVQHKSFQKHIHSVMSGQFVSGANRSQAGEGVKQKSS